MNLRPMFNPAAPNSLDGKSAQARWRAPIAAFLVVPVLLRLLVIHMTGVSWAIVNVDYLLVGALFPWVRRWIWGSAIVFLICLDLLMLASKIFYFEPWGFLTSIRTGLETDWAYVLTITCASLALSITPAWLATRFLKQPRQRLKTSSIFLTLTISIIVADAFIVGNALKARETSLLPINPATTAAYEFSLHAYEFGIKSRGGAIAVEKAPDAATNIIRSALQENQALPRNLVLVLSESWGHLLDPTAEALVREPLNNPQLAERYTVEQGLVPFLGPTVSGELRELCNIRTLNISPRTADLASWNCLPVELHRLGYETVAVHGFTGASFERPSWYPAVGFDHFYFQSDIVKAQTGVSLCGNQLRGVCDKDAFVWASKQLEKPGKNFLYFLSLNAHAPVPQPGPQLADCSRSPTTASSTAVCWLVGHYRIVVQSAIDLALSVGAEDTAFVIVGDHAPPSLLKATRNSFDQERVPYIILWPKGRSFPTPLN